MPHVKTHSRTASLAASSADASRACGNLFAQRGSSPSHSIYCLQAISSSVNPTPSCSFANSYTSINQ